MKFEFIIALIHSALFVIYAVKKSMNFKQILIFLLIIQYGPFYSLLKFNSIISLNLIGSLIIILLTKTKSTRNIKVKELLFVFSPFVIHVIGTIMYGYNFISFSKGILVICIIYAAVLLSRYFIKMGVTEVFRILSFSFALLAIITILVRISYEESPRDAGLPLIIVGFFVWALIEKRYFEISLFIVYLTSIQTRSILILFLIMLFFYRKELFISYGKFSSFILTIPTFAYVVYIIYWRTFLESDLNLDLESSLTFNAITRLNSVFFEFETFLNYPIFGAGMFFSDPIWRELLADQINLISTTEDYIAFNHIGLTSIAAQQGILGIFIFIIIPIRLIFKSKNTFGINKFIKGMLIIYLFSFLISGSPIRTDFPDMFYFMLLVSLFYNTSHNKNLTYDSLSQKI